MQPYQNFMYQPNMYQPNSGYIPTQNYVNTNYSQSYLPQVKVVNDFAEITANDVSMSVPFSIFAKNDLSEVQIRRWNAQGLIDNLVFKPIVEQQTDKSIPTEEKFEYGLSSEAKEDIYKHIDMRFEELKKLLRPSNTRTKKESESE